MNSQVRINLKIKCAELLMMMTYKKKLFMPNQERMSFLHGQLIILVNIVGLDFLFLKIFL
jgi:hypothetical protein